MTYGKQLTSGWRRAIALICMTLAGVMASPAQDEQASPDAVTFKNLFSFDGTDGNQPQLNLVQGFDGSLYGTTLVGGVNNQGAVFKMTPAGELTTIYKFCSQPNCADGG